jgi:hypothetical protein
MGYLFLAKVPAILYEAMVAVYTVSTSLRGHLRTSLVRESDSARVPMSQTRPYVGRKVGSQLMRLWWNKSEPGSRVNFAEPDSRSRLARVWALLHLEHIAWRDRKLSSMPLFLRTYSFAVAMFVYAAFMHK